MFENGADLSFATTVHTSGIGIGIHECGHALAAKFCFQGPWAKIRIFPFRGGLTIYNVGHGLTSFGRLLGIEGSKLLVTAGGIIASVTFGIVGLALGDYLQDSHPVIGHYLSLYSITQIAQEVLYGLSAFFVSSLELSHDFVRMWGYGIHPLVPVGLLILLPIIEKVVFKYLKC